MTNLFKITKLAILLICVWVLFLCAQEDFASHPELKWRTIETEHFLINYSQGTERTANLVAKIAEEVYPHVTGLYQYHPQNKTEFIIRDTDDYANGGAYFFDNKVEIWAENLDYILRGTHNWLRDVVTHEYTHIISMGKALKFGQNFPAGWFQIFGYEQERRKDVVRGFPDVLVSYPILGVTVPAWFAEGVAQFQTNSKRFDYRDSHREMILRDRVVTNKMLDLKQMDVFGKNSIGNESSYNLGFALVKFLSKTFGDTVLSRLAGQASSPLTLTFEGVMKKITGIPADSLYRMWHSYLNRTYRKRLETVQKHLTIGKPLDDKGIGNIHPIYSPDGKKIAYVEGKSDYLSVNAVVVEDLKSGKKKRLAGPVSSSLSWSPDGRYLLYSRHTSLPPNWNFFNDIYIYDTRRYKEFPVTKRMRAKNPDWSHDGKKIVYVVQSDGMSNLYVQELEELVHIKNKKKWQIRFFDLNRYRVIDKLPSSPGRAGRSDYRKVEFWGKNLRQLTQFANGRQFYHPRWAPDDSYIIFDTSINFCRDIAKIPAGGGKIDFILDAAYDERYPTFSPKDGKIYFTSDRTGIFNIYSYDPVTGKKEAHTNVVGGGFMPTVNREGQLVYSLYRNQGYKIYRISRVEALPKKYLLYDENYEAKIPVIKEDDRQYNPLPSTPYKRSFGPVAIWPRLLLDYKTVKPGFYVSSNEILDKMSFFGGVDANKDKEYDLFGLFEFRGWKPANIFFNFFNQTARIEDNYSDPDSFTVSSDKVKVNFNLLAAEFGLGTKFRNAYNLRLTYSYSLYRAKIGTFAFRELANPDQILISPNIRYSYLKGHSLSLSVKRQRILPEIDRGINPRKGYYFYLKMTHDWNKFLDEFATDRVVGLEIFKNYYYNKFELDVERYFPVPGTRRHSLSFRVQAGYIDQPVDDFFNFFAGSIVGLKGYPYYSIEGRKMAIGTVSYRFPLFRNMNLQLLNFYFDKLYLGGFYQAGDAWNTGSPTWDQVKSDIGLQLRLETFSWYMPAPIRIFFEAAYPLKAHQNKEIMYSQEWKFYFGVLFDFNLRFDKKLRVFR